VCSSEPPGSEEQVSDRAALATLREIGAPLWLALVGEPAAAYELAWKVARDQMVTKVLRGSKMTSLDSLFAEIGAALQFPDYFGEIWPALDECLLDLSWMQVPVTCSW
jgi:hypothetical protein